MNVQRIRGFLLQQPKPAAIRLTGGECGDESQMLSPGRSYAKTAETIAALSPDLVECLDKDGRLLRAHRTDTEDSRRSDAAAIPDGLKADPTALMLTHCANLIHRAYEHSTEVAFKHLIELCDKMNDRSASIEQRLERTEARNRQLLQEQVDDALDRARDEAERSQAGDGSMLEQMAGAFLSGKMAGIPPKNGKGSA